MATASGNPMDMLEKELSCSICLNLLREPKDLDCAHTYCFDCLKQFVKKKSTIDCPDCRNITIVPQGGLANLKTNLRIKNVVENIIQGTGQIRSKKPMEVPMCPDHIGERQHFVCVTCSVSVCHNCLVLKHPKPQHEIREWKEVMEEEEKQRRQKNQELDDVEGKLKRAKDKAKQEVKSLGHRATTEIKMWEKKMDQDIETTYQTRMNILQERRKCLNRSVTRSKICFHDDELPHDMTVLHLEPAQISSNFGKLVTTANKKPVTSTNQNRVGSANKKLKVTLLTAFNADAMHVAANQSNLIAVVPTGGKRISVYGQYNGGYKEQCCLGLNNFPSSVAISSQGKFFVSDGGEVKIFSPAGKYENAWPKSVDAGRIAIAPDNSIVIGRKSGDAITVHQCDNGKLIRTHQVQCSEMGDIASNGEQIAFTTYNTACVIDFVTGHRMWTVSMTDPHGVCYEHSSNTLLVSRGDFQHGVIEQYCSTTGRLISCLASNLYCPWGMTVTQDNKLVVADWNRVKIFNISS